MFGFVVCTAGLGVFPDDSGYWLFLCRWTFPNKNVYQKPERNQASKNPIIPERPACLYNSAL